MAVDGIPDMRAALSGLVPKLKIRAVRTSLAAGARVVRDTARRAAPVLSPSSPAVRSGIRKPGTVRNAISVRTSKLSRRAGNVGVFVNVKPAQGAVYRKGRAVRASQRGAKSPNDPYYWRWLEFGRAARSAQAARQRIRRGAGARGVRARRALRAVGAMAGAHFLAAGAARLPQALQVFIAKLGPQIERLAKKGASA